MPIYKDEARQTYYVSYRTKDPVTGKLTQHTKRGFQKQADAKQFLAERQLESDPTTSVSFAVMNEKYVRYKNPRQETQDQEMMRVQKYMKQFKDKPMSKITKVDLLDWQTWLDAQDIATFTKNNCISIVCGTYKFANAFYEIPNISMVLKRFKKKQSEIFEMATWTVAEFNQFIKVEDNEIYRNLFTFLYWTGCRRGEALGLRKQDYDPASGTIYIHHAVKDYKREGFKELKNSSSIRRIKLDTTTNRMIADLCNSLPDGDSWLFGINEPVSVNTLQKRFVKDIRESGVKQIRLHDLRHSFATNAVNHGVNIVALSKYLGHSTIEQTLATYSHLLEKTADEMNKIMSTMHASS